MQRHHRIQRQRHELEPEIEGQEVVRRDHDHHAEQREHRQHERLAAEQAARRQIASRIEKHQHHRQAAHEIEQVAEGVGDEHVAEGAHRRLVKHDQRRQRGCRNAEQRQPVGNVALGFRHEQVDHQHRASADQQHDRGQRRKIIECECGDGRHHSLLLATCASRSVTEACITSVNGFG